MENDKVVIPTEVKTKIEETFPTRTINSIGLWGKNYQNINRQKCAEFGYILASEENERLKEENKWLKKDALNYFKSSLGDAKQFADWASQQDMDNLTYEELIQKYEEFNPKEVQILNLKEENERLKGVNENALIQSETLLNYIISGDPNVVNNYKDSDLVIRSLYDRCKKLVKHLTPLSTKSK